MAKREADVDNGVDVDETRILLEDAAIHPGFLSFIRVRSIARSVTHRRMTVLEDVALLAVVGAAEGAALVELDEHRVRGVPGAVDVDAVLVVGVAWHENTKCTYKKFTLPRSASFYRRNKSFPRKCR